MSSDVGKLEIERERLAYKAQRQATRNATKTQRTQRAARRRAFWSQFTTNLPVRLALLGVAGVWLLGCVWSFREQTALAAASGFATPWVLPLLVDGFAASCAGVAYAASLDGRAAVAARAMTGLAVACSASSNGLWAWERSDGYLPTVTLAVGVPLVANLAFEVLLGERRRVVKRRRGLPAPTPVEPPRLVRLVLSPLREFWAWRRRTLALTAPSTVREQVEACERSDTVASTQPEDAADPEPAPVENAEPAEVEAATVTSPVEEEQPNRHSSWPATPTQGRGVPARAWRLDRIVEQLEAGAELDGPKVGALAGVSARQGQRDLKDAQNVLARRQERTVTDRVASGEQPRLVSVRSAGEGN